MYGLGGKIVAIPNKRDELVTILIKGSRKMPGNKVYIVSKDNNDPNGVFVIEAWDSKESHQNSLKLESVQSAIAERKPLIANFESYTEITRIGGTGI